MKRRRILCTYCGNPLDDGTPTVLVNPENQEYMHLECVFDTSDLVTIIEHTLETTKYTVFAVAYALDQIEKRRNQTNA